ncbi:hypothetical protein F5Y03DRAFT_402114 [Xylaria venustula]|nr:hypothetical protein F5Y03DRAFT_402114 [Xylaria venustula]
MARYPIECRVCSEDVLSNEDHLRHYLRHQSQITLLVQDLFGREHSEACESDAATNSESRYKTVDLISQGQKGNYQTPTQRQVPGAKRPKKLQCPEGGCKREFSTPQKLVRHRFTHYDWNRACNHCFDTFTKASAFIQHACGAKQLKQKQMYDREKQVEIIFGLNITDGKPVQQEKRIKTGTLTASAQASIYTTQTTQGMPLLVAGSASSTQALINTFQTTQGMPSLEGDSGEPSASTNVNENTQNHVSL